MGSGDWFKTLISRKSKERKPKKGKGTLASAKLSALNSNDCTRRDSSDLANGAKAENIGSVETLLQQESRLHSGLIRKALRRLKGIIKLQIVTQINVSNYRLNGVVVLKPWRRLLEGYIREKKQLLSVKELWHMTLDEIKDKSLRKKVSKSTCKDFVSLVQAWLRKIQRSKSLWGVFAETNQSELSAFISYALAFPNNFLALVDTYDVIQSGIPNFCAVALAFNELGYKAVGIRLDSGDLAYLSCQARKIFCFIEKEFAVSGFGKTSITASNDLKEETLDALNK
ncbi:hypothetical protein AHAS_Ahas01G0099500 [Arachis hypogaea]